MVTAYIEMTPFDSVKYEVDKETGYLRVDRPQRYSSRTPTLYGFIPQTYCAEKVQALSPGSDHGDGDPLDICVLSERPIAQSEILLNARVIGGIRMIDGGEADDKVIAVLDNDEVYAGVDEIKQVPPPLIDRLRHYFMTYKMRPDSTDEKPVVSFDGVYGRAEAEAVILAAIDDYAAHFSRMST